MQNTSNTIQAWVNSVTYRHPSDKLYSTQTVHSSYTNSVEIKVKPMFHHVHNLSFTASGYGKRIPTQYIVKFNGKWRRVYCKIYSNNGTLYIGQLNEYGERLIVRIDN